VVKAMKRNNWAQYVAVRVEYVSQEDDQVLTKWTSCTHFFILSVQPQSLLNSGNLNGNLKPEKKQNCEKENQ
jgi:hypothetical protein